MMSSSAYACARVRIGEDVSERLDDAALKFWVIMTRRFRYASQACREVIVQAPAPARPRAASRQNGFWPASPSPSMPIACRCIGRKRFSRVRRSNPDAISLLAGWPDTLTKIVNGHLNTEIDDLLPWAYASPQPLKHMA